MRCVIPIAHVSMPNNRSNGIADETNIVCYASMQVGGQHEQHHVPRDL